MRFKVTKYLLTFQRTLGTGPSLTRAVACFSSAFLIVFLHLSSCAQTGKTVPTASENVLYAELAKAPRKAVARHNPLASDPDAVAAGGKLYGMHCAECHGETGEGGHGSKKGPSLRAEEVQRASSGTLFWVLTNGVVRRGMPVWSKLPEPQRWQLVSFIKSLSVPHPGPGQTPHPHDRP
ncbi:MAG TPA: cytochrome c [Candidatus Eisenbacteria bacterium]|nr:cytochrome c [Candidatus Eisenbacteria bacterium]